MDQTTTSNYQSIMSQIKELQTQADSIRHAERMAALEQIQSIMRGYNISIQDIRAGKLVTITRDNGTGTQRKPIPAKYMHPTSGKTWSGRGKKPQWLEIELSAGATLDQFKISK